MQSLPSYAKDTTDFITKLKQFQVTSQKTYLVTLDVSSLYTNISISEACRYFLENNGHSSGSLSIDNVCSLIERVLKNNHSMFNDCYRQRMGTALGGSIDQAYFLWVNLRWFYKTLFGKAKTLVKVFRRHFYVLDTQSR